MMKTPSRKFFLRFLLAAFVSVSILFGLSLIGDGNLFGTLDETRIALEDNSDDLNVDAITPEAYFICETHRDAKVLIPFGGGRYMEESIYLTRATGPPSQQS